MKVAIITETYPPEINGVAMTLSRLVNGLSDRNIAVQVIRPRQSKNDHSKTVGNIHNEVVRGFPLPGYDSLHFGLPANRQLKKLWSQKKPDIVYIATEGPLGLFARRLAAKLGITTCSGFHTNFQMYMEHYKLGVFGKWVLAYLRSFHNNTAATFVPSLDILKDLEELGFKNVKILGRGVDTDLFSPVKRSEELRQSWEAKQDTPVFAYVGRVAAEKNIELSIQTFLKIQSQIPQAKMVVVGDGPALPSLQEKYPWIHFSGMQTGEDLAVHYASTDVFLFASTSETFGNVVTEAMASGVIVQAFDYAAPQKYICDGQNGYLVPLSNPQDYLQKSEQLLADQNDWPSIRRAARETAKQVSWEKVLSKFIEDLNALLCSGKG